MRIWQNSYLSLCMQKLFYFSYFWTCKMFTLKNVIPVFCGAQVNICKENSSSSLNSVSGRTSVNFSGYWMNWCCGPPFWDLVWFKFGYVNGYRCLPLFTSVTLQHFKENKTMQMDILSCVKWSSVNIYFERPFA